MNPDIEVRVRSPHKGWTNWTQWYWMHGTENNLDNILRLAFDRGLVQLKFTYPDGYESQWRKAS